MSYSNIVEKIKKFEAKEDLSLMMYEGVNIWFILRSEIQLQFREKNKHISSPIPRLKKLYFLFKIKKLERWIDSKYSYKFNKTDILLYSENDSYIESINGNNYHKHFDPLIESIIKLNLSFKKVFRVNQKQKSVIENDNLNLNEYSELIWLKTEYKSDAYIHLLDKVASYFSLNKFSLTKRIVKTFEEAFYFNKILNQYEPKIAFVVCYYSRLVYPFLLACKQKGIKVIDIQHGKQGEHHICYTDFNFFPKEISLLPDYYWNWNQYSSDNINKSILDSISKPKTLIGGFLWESFYKKNRISTVENKELIKLTKPYKHVVLLGTQPVEDGFFEPWLFSKLERHTEILFLIRLHPSQIEEDITQLNYFNKIKNVDFKLSNKLPLIDIIEISNMVISKWSSISLEALLNSKKSVIIHKTGEKAFKKLIDDKIILYTEDFDEILKYLSDTNKKNIDLCIYNYSFKEENVLKCLNKLII